MKKKIRQGIYIFLCGFLGGVFTEYGFSVVKQRWGNCGGEILIMPLIVLLIYLGVQIGLTFSKDNTQPAVQEIPDLVEPDNLEKNQGES